jgi:hypothetical protein
MNDRWHLIFFTREPPTHALLDALAERGHKFVSYQTTEQQRRKGERKTRWMKRSPLLTIEMDRDQGHTIHDLAKLHGVHVAIGGWESRRIEEGSQQ